MKRTQHVPVLLPVVLEELHLKKGNIVVDATLGGGAYTRALWTAVQPTGTVIAFDWDRKAIKRFESEIAEDAFLEEAKSLKHLILIESNFANLQERLRELGYETVDAIVADLGLSSDQLSDPERGLSFAMDGPLDMRLNSSETVTAAKILNTWSAEELTDLFRTYGDESEAGKIARAIVKRRDAVPLTRSQELASLISETVRPVRRFGRIHPATQVFQALRMAVNSEARSLNDFLPQAVTCLKPHGKIALVTFHSGEDRTVKHFFQQEARGCTCGLVPCVCEKKERLRILTKKPILPREEEVEGNPRARSAKLRIAERV